MSNIGTKFILAQRFVFDPNSNSLVDQMSDGEVVRLGSNESRILLMLSEKPNEVITRNELHEYVWRDQGFEVDNSSLTQAISTLRKMLKDSTKSPKFVKTVPKRGYQFIASVERSVPLLSSEQPIITARSENEVEPPLPTTTEDVIIEMTASELTTKTQGASANKEHKVMNSTGNRNSNKWLSFSVLIAAILMPLLVLSLSNPTKSEFLTLAEVDGVKVQAPINHPDLSSWLSVIEKCVVHYNNNHIGILKPTKVIATGGQSNKLTLNYIHSQEYSTENITLKIYANQSDLNDICKGHQ